MRFLFLFFLAAAPAFGARVICYWNGKSFWRDGTAKVTVEDIKVGASLCTHLIYGFATIDNDDYHIEPIDKKLDLDKGKGQWRAVASLKNSQPGLSVLLSVGGYEDLKNEKYFEVLEKPERRTKFINTVVSLLREFKFDGIDLAWQFPPQHEKYETTSIKSMWHKVLKTFGAGVDSLAIEHRDQFVALCRELKAQLRPDGKLLSIGLLPHVNSTTYMDVRSLMPYVDMVNLWAVDFRTPDRAPHKADYVHPLVFLYPRLPHQNVEAVVRHWLDHGAEPQKLNLGIATWGRSWKLNEDSVLSSGTPPVIASGPGEKGPHTKTAGLLAYYEVCIKLVSPTNPTAPAGMLRKVSDPERKMGAYAFRLPDQRAGESEGLWVGFEEPDTAAAKALYAKGRGLGGVAILDLGLDDSRGICDGNRYPITRAAKLSLDNIGGISTILPAQPAFPVQPPYNGAPSQSYIGVPQPPYSGVPPQPSYGNVQLPQPGYGNIQPAQPAYGGVPQPGYGGVQTPQQGFGGVQSPQQGFGGVQPPQQGFGGVQPPQPGFNYTPNRTQIIYSPSHNGR
ncbi:chitinase-like protein EN03 [Halyomorpha halys]|uniref:chitinase-like protein EN03 n=1 Tax=Halyomorpha halys TaxID=286706 RepID=UPI0006D50394|nr:chitinase-like protein EN03 [Halyomorpha halys]